MQNNLKEAQMIQETQNNYKQTQNNHRDAK